MRLSLAACFVLSCAMALSGCYYSSPSPLIANSASSCAGLTGIWLAQDPNAIARSRQSGQRAPFIGGAVPVQYPDGCDFFIRLPREGGAIRQNGLPSSNLFGLDRDLGKNFFAAHNLGRDNDGNTLLLLQIRPSSAPGVSFGASAPVLYAYAVRTDTPDGSMLTVMKPTCNASSCSVASLSEASNIVMRELSQPNPSNVLVILLKAPN